MLASSTRILRLPRSGGLASPAVVRAAARRTSRPRPSRARFQSSSSSGSPSPGGSSHLASGVAGGVTVLVAGYAIYYFSDLRKTVQAAKSAKIYFQQTKDQLATTVSEKFSSDSPMVQNSNEVLRYLRNIARSYVAVVPGLSSYVDTTFDSLDKIAAEHADEAREITQGAYDEIQKIVNESKSKSGNLSDVGPDAAFKVLDVLRRRTAELYELGKKAGGTAVDELLEKNPQVKEKLGGGYEQLKGLVESRGPEAKKALDEVSNKVKNVVSQGPNADNLTDLANLIREKTDQVRQMAEPAAQEAWDKALSSASPYLDKLPDIRQILDEKKSAFLALGASALATGGGDKGDLGEVMKRAKEVAEVKDEKQRKEKAQKLKEFVLQKAEEAQKKIGSMGGGIAGKLSWDSVEGYVKTLPGGEQMLQKAPNAKALLELSKDKGEDASKLAKETWEEVLKVLEAKGQKARELANDTREEGKQKAKK